MTQQNDRLRNLTADEQAEAVEMLRSIANIYSDDYDGDSTPFDSRAWEIREWLKEKGLR